MHKKNLRNSPHLNRPQKLDFLGSPQFLRLFVFHLLFYAALYHFIFNNIKYGIIVHWHSPVKATWIYRNACRTYCVAITDDIVSAPSTTFGPSENASVLSAASSGSSYSFSSSSPHRESYSFFSFCLIIAPIFLAD